MTNLRQFLPGLGGFEYQEFLNSGQFTVPDGVELIYISGCGAGGGGQAGGAIGSASTALGGIAGSSGAAILDFPQKVTPGQVIDIVIGVGGVGGIGTNLDTGGNPGNPGAIGTPTSIGDIVLPAGAGGNDTLQDNAGKPPLDLDDNAHSTGVVYHGARSTYPCVNKPGLDGAIGGTGKLGGKGGGASPFSKGGDGGDGGTVGAPGQDGSPGSKGSGGGGGGACYTGNLSGSGAPGGDGYALIKW
ncbi:MAG: hypothetical protein KZQ84_10060 [Candidatus Thiodiazotropha sp. (ex Lucinoma borealis)]|nr:hypothetical protein [Candidatus Thiodiazotropha sp. (ex Lucinoma borealis)]